MGDMQQSRQLYIMRHAERMDFTFGTKWISNCFDEDDNYVRSNLNMPQTIPKRRGGSKDYKKDCPLTRIGLMQATLAGEGMKLCNVTFSHVFSSPSLRCVETCRNVLEASSQSHLPINIEPGLFEWLTWYTDGMPKWMSLDEFKEHGFNVSGDYVPVIPEKEMLTRKESSEEYYDRSYKVACDISLKYPGNILFVAHASSLDTCSRQLVGRQPENEVNMLKLVTKVSYTAIAVVQMNSDSQCKLIEPPVLPLKHLNNAPFEWRTLLD